MARFKDVFKIFNLHKRFKLEWVSGSEGKRLTEVITEFTDKLKNLDLLQAL